MAPKTDKTPEPAAEAPDPNWGPQKILTLGEHLQAMREFQANARALVADAAQEVDEAFHREALEDARPGVLRRYDRIHAVLRDLPRRIGLLPIRVPDEAIREEGSSDDTED